jgi:hypothetical protein
VGTKKNTAFKGGARRTELFVSRVENSVTTDDIKSFFQEEEGVTLVDIVKKSKADATTQSFHMTVECTDPTPLLTDPAFWPENVCCRRYYTKPRRPRRQPEGSKPDDAAALTDSSSNHGRSAP